MFLIVLLGPVREKERKEREEEKDALMKHREEEINKITSICNEMA